MARTKALINYVELKDEEEKAPAPAEEIQEPHNAGNPPECRFYGEFGRCQHPRVCPNGDKHIRVGTTHLGGCVWQDKFRTRCANYQPNHKKEAVGFANVMILDPELHGHPYIRDWMEVHPVEKKRMVYEYSQHIKKKENEDANPR